MRWRIYETPDRGEITLIPVTADTEDRRHLLGVGAVLVAEFEAETIDDATAVRDRRYGWGKAREDGEG